MTIFEVYPLYGLDVCEVCGSYQVSRIFAVLIESLRLKFFRDADENRSAKQNASVRAVFQIQFQMLYSAIGGTYTCISYNNNMVKGLSLLRNAFLLKGTQGNTLA